jgi:hypothetical protein
MALFLADLPIRIALDSVVTLLLALILVLGIRQSVRDLRHAHQLVQSPLADLPPIWGDAASTADQLAQAHRDRLRAILTLITVPPFVAFAFFLLVLHVVSA